MTSTPHAIELAVAALDWVERELALSDAEIGQALGVDRKLIYRWRMREREPTPDQLSQLEKLPELRRLVENAFRTPELGKRWFRQPAPALKGRTPISALRDGQIDNVLRLLATTD